jgi:hypothetical protein
VAGSFFVIPSIFVLWLLSYLAAPTRCPAIKRVALRRAARGYSIVVEAVLRIGTRPSTMACS